MALLRCSCLYTPSLTVEVPDPTCAAHCTCYPELPDPECLRHKEN